MQKKKLARIVSEISNGFLTMILTPVIPIVLSNLDPFDKLVLSITYPLVALMPYFALKAMGLVSDYEFTDRKERPPYFTTISLLFGIAYILVRTYNSTILTDVALNFFVVSSVITFITYFWKISGHMTYSTILFTTLIYVLGSPYLFLLFLFTPFIGWSRIALEKHTLTQVTAGTLVTLAISTYIYWGI